MQFHAMHAFAVYVGRGEVEPVQTATKQLDLVAKCWLLFATRLGELPSPC